ncbi:MAG: class III signal peptide-containing protein [Candidatus Micrarchaeota archaeon]|nr:class III signal peptide-containing protein [Candidatus Micrarchaeota archaeon]
MGGRKAQTAVEYLLLVVAGVVIVAIIAYFIKTRILG